jgi:hypothetical protein
MDEMNSDERDPYKDCVTVEEIVDRYEEVLERLRERLRLGSDEERIPDRVRKILARKTSSGK